MKLNKAIENRDLNNPEKLPSFKYQSYNKFYITYEKDKLELKESFKQAKIQNCTSITTYIHYPIKTCCWVYYHNALI